MAVVENGYLLFYITIIIFKICFSISQQCGEEESGYLPRTFALKPGIISVSHNAISNGRRTVDGDSDSTLCMHECISKNMSCISAIFDNTRGQCNLSCDSGHYGYTSSQTTTTMVKMQTKYKYEFQNIKVEAGLEHGHAIYLYGYLGSNLWKTHINLYSRDRLKLVYHIVFDNYGSHNWASTANAGNGFPFGVGNWNLAAQTSSSHELNSNSKFFIKLEGTESQQLKITLNGEYEYVLNNVLNIPMSEVGWINYGASSHGWIKENTLQNMCIE